MPPLKSRPHHPDLGQPSSSSSSPSSTQQHQQQQHTVMCVCARTIRVRSSTLALDIYLFLFFFCRSVVVRREFMMRRSRLVEPFSPSFFCYCCVCYSITFVFRGYALFVRRIRYPGAEGQLAHRNGRERIRTSSA